MNLPSWLKPLGTIVAVLLVGILLAGVLGVPFRSMLSPHGYDQPRVHWNTKNTTRFVGDNASQVAARVSRALYPAVDDATRPDVVLLYDPDDWQGGLAAAALLRPLNAVLLPATGDVGEEIERLGPPGSEVVAGAQLLLVNGATAPEGEWTSRSITPDDLLPLLEGAGREPLHAVLVNPDDPATALLAAPWVAYSSDLVIFDPADAPADLPLYALGSAEAEGAVKIGGADPAATAAAFAAYEDPDNPRFGWGMNAESLTGYRAFSIARPDDPATALLSANLARRGKPGPLLWTEERRLPQRVNNYAWSQRAAFWVTPSEGPFHHFYILGGTDAITFPAQGQADYAVEIGPYFQKGAGLGPMDMLSAGWVMIGIASALWIAFHEVKFLPGQSWVLRLAWPLLALSMGPFGILLYWLAYSRPVIEGAKMRLWDRPLWLQGLVATASGVGFGGLLMVVTGWIATFFGLPLFPAEGPLFFFGSPMILVMILNYVVAVLVSWLLYQTPMLAMFHGRSYAEMLPRALPVVLASMASVSLAMFPGMWWLMNWKLPMMPSEESILWFGVMFFTVFMGFVVAWPFNYIFIRRRVKGGLM
ncbi:MAG: DUF4396 domain-containing protein [Anaerolineales bacterium]